MYIDCILMIFPTRICCWINLLLLSIESFFLSPGSVVVPMKIQAFDEQLTLLGGLF